MRSIAIAVFAGSLAACASSTPPASTAPATTFSAQVAQGRVLYGENCASCHGDSGEGDRGPRVVGLAQGALPLDPPATREVRKTRFVTVADVATFVVSNMPPDAPGSLSQEQYLAILAFDLKANGIDLGQEKLTLEKAAQLTIPR